MRRGFAIGVALLAVLCQQAQAASAENAPNFTLAGRTGTVTLADYRGKFVYLDFWASWCAPCKHSFPWMGSLQQRYGQDRLQVIALSVDRSKEDADAFLATTPASFVIAYDMAGEVAKKYAIKGMPSSFLIGPDGTVLLVHAGFTATTPAELDQVIRTALQSNAKEGER